MNSMESRKSNRYWPTKILVALWLVGVLVYAQYRHPEFWKDDVDHYRAASRLAQAERWAEAGLRIDRALKMSPTTASYWILKGDIELAQDRVEPALSAYQSAFQADARNPETWFALVRAYDRAGQPESAVKVLLRLKPEELTTADRLRRARALAQNRRIPEALEDVRALLSVKPGDAAILSEAAVLEEAAQNHEAAAARYEELGRLRGETPELCARVGTLYRWAGKPDVALEWYLKALRQPSTVAVSNAVVWGLTAAGVETGEPASALPWARQLLANQPDDPEAVALAIRALMRGGAAADAVAAFDRLAALRPLTPAERLLLAGQCRSAGDAGRAAAVLQALPVDELTAEQRVERLRILTSAGDAESAIRESEKLLANRPGPELERELWRKLAEMNGVLNRHEASAGWYVKWAEGEPDAALARKARLAAASAWRAAGRPEEAWSVLASGAGPDTLAVRAELAMELKRYADAERLLVELVGAPVRPEADPARVNDLATVWEMNRQYAPAISLVRSLLERGWGDRTAQTLRLADLLRWNGQSDEAVKHYLQALAGMEPGPAAMAARYGLALALLDLRQGREALEALKPLLDQKPGEPDQILAAARAASLLGDAGLTADLLDRLAGLRPLTRDERIWLAGQDRKAGRSAKALAAYRELTKDPAADRSLLEACGDLCADAGDLAGALAAYQRISGVTMDRDLALKMARAARESAGNVALALKLYDEVLATPLGEIPEVRLEAARFFVNASRQAQAYTLYTNVAAVKSWEGQAIELMRAALAAQVFVDAEKYARDRLEQDEKDWRAQLGLVQALHLQGKTREAARLLDQHKEGLMNHPEGREWMGLVAMARDRHLEAFRIFDGLVQDEGTARRRYWIWRGRAAQALGDRAAAEESYKKAAAFPSEAGDLKADEETADRQMQQIRGAGGR